MTTLPGTPYRYLWYLGRVSALLTSGWKSWFGIANMETVPERWPILLVVATDCLVCTLLESLSLTCSGTTGYYSACFFRIGVKRYQLAISCERLTGNRRVCTIEATVGGVLTAVVSVKVTIFLLSSTFRWWWRAMIVFPYSHHRGNFRGAARWLGRLLSTSNVFLHRWSRARWTFL